MAKDHVSHVWRVFLDGRHQFPAVLASDSIPQTRLDTNYRARSGGGDLNTERERMLDVCTNQYYDGFEAEMFSMSSSFLFHHAAKIRLCVCLTEISARVPFVVCAGSCPLSRETC